MKKFCNYTFRAVCIYLVILIVAVFATTKIEIETFDRNVLNANISKELNSILIVKKTEKDTCEIENEEIEQKKVGKQILEVESEEEPLKSTPTPIPTPEPTPEPTPVPTPIITSEKPQYNYVQTIDTTNIPVIATTSGNVSHYGHDCYGCTSGKTATGYDISDGRIYYTDPTYGSVRIVAAGYEYPFGTILRLSNETTAPTIAIVLDRGGAIGSGKKYILDLLTESNAQAYQAGVKYNMTIEVLRMGY